MNYQEMQQNQEYSRRDIGQNIGNGDGVFISTYGCQMNVNDSERMMSLLEMMNFRSVTSPDQASLIIINSCSVREKPVHKVHSEVGRYQRLKEKNPKLKIGVAGCVAQQEKAQLMKDIPMIDFVMGTDAIDKLPELVSKSRSKELTIGELENKKARQEAKKALRNEMVSAKFEHQQPYHVETLVRNPGVSTFVNIAKGCDNFCTFCVVPFTRGRERSRPLNHVIEDVKLLIKRGVKEVTLLGQNVNSYKSECGADFTKLLKAMTETDIERVRYTTPHPKDFNKELLEVMRDHSDKLMNYVHLPAQSGNTEVLKRMNRGYTREEYIDKAKMVLDTIPGVALSTDLIVGFPGETEEQFQDTMSLIEEVPYESIFAFAYSPRPFTKAAKFEDALSEEVKNERLNRLFEKHNTLAFEWVKKYLGQTLEVLVEYEASTKGRMVGRSTQNKSVFFDGDKNLIGQTVKVRIDEAFPLTLHGERV